MPDPNTLPERLRAIAGSLLFHGGDRLEVEAREVVTEAADALERKPDPGSLADELEQAVSRLVPGDDFGPTLSTQGAADLMRRAANRLVELEHVDGELGALLEANLTAPAFVTETAQDVAKLARDLPAVDGLAAALRGYAASSRSDRWPGFGGDAENAAEKLETLRVTAWDALHSLAHAIEGRLETAEQRDALVERLGDLERRANPPRSVAVQGETYVAATFGDLVAPPGCAFVGAVTSIEAADEMLEQAGRPAMHLRAGLPSESPVRPMGADRDSLAEWAEHPQNPPVMIGPDASAATVEAAHAAARSRAIATGRPVSVLYMDKHGPTNHRPTVYTPEAEYAEPIRPTWLVTCLPGDAQPEPSAIVRCGPAGAVWRVLRAERLESEAVRETLTGDEHGHARGDLVQAGTAGWAIELEPVDPHDVPPTARVRALPLPTVKLDAESPAALLPSWLRPPGPCPVAFQWGVSLEVVTCERGDGHGGDAHTGTTRDGARLMWPDTLLHLSDFTGVPGVRSAESTGEGVVTLTVAAGDHARARDALEGRVPAGLAVRIEEAPSEDAS